MVIYSVIGVLVLLVSQSHCGDLYSDQSDLENDNREGHIKVAQPLTFGSALQDEVQRLHALNNEVYPPTNLSYYTPYGDRSIVALQFPPITDNDFNKEWEQYAAPEYGPPPKKKLRKSRDFGVLISQNYIHRENVRAQGDFAKVFQFRRSSQETLKNIGKLVAVAMKVKKSRGSGVNKSVLKQLQKELDNSRAGWGWKPEPPPSFAVVHIESRIKVSPNVRDEQTLTNGSLIFPSPSNPDTLAFIPFILRKPEDIKKVFQGHEADMKGLIPEERKGLLSLLKFSEGIHQDTFQDGKERLSRVRGLSRSLSRPRLPRTELLSDDPLAAEEDLARQTYWLHTSTMAIRTFSPPAPAPVLLTPVIPIYEVPAVPVYGPPISEIVLQPAYGDLPPPPVVGYGEPDYTYKTLAKKLKI